MHRRLLHKNQEVAKQNPPGVPKTSTKGGPGMRKKVRIIHPFTKRKTGSSLLKKKVEMALNGVGSRLESLGKCC